jgi:ribonuclease E
MTKEMFINAQRDECRIAIVTDGALAELYTERASSLSRVGNIYKGSITNVEPSIQAAFVDFGGNKNGFLHISDLNPRYFPGGGQQMEVIGKKRARRERPPIQSCLRKQQEVTVQVTKEGIGTKGATLTTYLSIPGRYLVLMPGMHRLGVSRRAEDETARFKARSILEELKPPPGMGFIVRTAGLDRNKQDLQRDLNYLLRLWQAVSQRSKDARAPAELYQESDLVIRTIRDVYDAQMQRVVCDDEAVACKVKEFLRLIMPRSRSRVEFYSGKVGLFDAFGLEQELESINSPRVPLPSGGSVVLEQTEALVAIDVNSGRLRDADNAETTALRTNLEAAREVARQLRLRDMGGVIIIDFIDMAMDKNRREVEKVLRGEIRKDRARTQILRMSRFGIVEMTRQRMRPSLASSIFRPCPQCGGAGRIKSEESQGLAVIRTLRLAADDPQVARIEVTVSPPVADHILNQRRGEVTALERACSTKILFHADPHMAADQIRIICTDARGSTLPWEASRASERRPRDVPTREITEADVASFRKRQRAAKEVAAPPPAPAEPKAEPPAGEQAEPRKRGRRRRRKKPAQAQAPAETKPPAEAAEPPKPPEQAQAAPPPRKRPRRRRRRKKSTATPAASGQAGAAPPPQKSDS